MINFSKLLCFIVLLILFSTTVTALGISPGKKAFVFEPSQQQTIPLYIVNNEKRAFTAAVFVRGDLAPYVSLSQQQVTFTQDQDQQELSYTLALPESFDTPGSHTAEIVVRELSGQNDQGEIVIGTLVSVVSQVEVTVPFPGTYAKTDLNIVSSASPEFYVSVHNLGEQDIAQAQATISIQDDAQTEIASVTTDALSIPSKMRDELSAIWEDNVALGQYTAIATIEYDGETSIIEKIFTLGDFFIELLDISVKNFQLGGIAKFNVLLQNNANQPIEAVTIEMQLADEQGQGHDLKSPVESLAAEEIKEVSVFWDTDGLSEGEYTGTLSVIYGENREDKAITLTVTEDSITANVAGLTGHVVGGADIEGGGTEIVYIIVIGILVLIIIGLIMFMRR